MPSHETSQGLTILIELGLAQLLKRLLLQLNEWNPFYFVG